MNWYLSNQTETLVSGDVVQNKVVPGVFRDGGTPSSWLACL